MPNLYVWNGSAYPRWTYVIYSFDRTFHTWNVLHFFSNLRKKMSTLVEKICFCFVILYFKNVDFHVKTHRHSVRKHGLSAWHYHNYYPGYITVQNSIGFKMIIVNSEDAGVRKKNIYFYTPGRLCCLQWIHWVYMALTSLEWLRGFYCSGVLTSEHWCRSVKYYTA